MDSPSTLIIGANGQLGMAWRGLLPNATCVDRDELDIADAESVKNFDWSKITLILNAAAYTAVDLAETEDGRKMAWKINAEAITNLARAATDHDLTLVHISTDYVFDGLKENPYVESDAICPLGVYGQSKAAGDLLAMTTPKHYVLRTSWVIGEGKNFVKTMLQLAQNGINPSVVNDQFGRLTFTDSLASAALHLVSNNAAYGVYNATCSGPKANWCEIAKQVFELSGHDPQRVSSTSTDEYFGKAKSEGKPISPRPINSMLDLHKLEGAGFAPKSWEDSLKEYIENEVKQ